MEKDKIVDIRNIGYALNNDQDADYIINMLKNQLQQYKMKNECYDEIMSKLKLTPDSLSLVSRETLNKFATLQEASGINKFETVDIEMSYLDNAAERYKYENESDILKIQYEDLCHRTENGKEDIKNVERELEIAKTRIDEILPMSQTELQKLEIQIKSYEENLIQYVNKYPWLKNPEYNLLSIQEEIKKVFNLQEEMEALKSDTECYCGLKPDLFTAKNQLSKIKAEYERVCKLVSEKECSN